MKKLIALLCATAMLLCLVTACGKEGGSDTSSGTFSNNTYTPIKRAEIKYEKIGEASTKPKNTYKSGDVKEISVSVSGADENKTISLQVGKKAALSYTLIPAKPAITAVYWESSNEAIVKVDKDGQILGMMPGSATVTCETVLGFTDTVTVYVYEYAGNDELSNKLLTLLNDARVKELSANGAASDKTASDKADKKAADKTASGYSSAEQADPNAAYKLKTGNVALQYAVNQRVYEEACEGSMNTTRPNFYGAGDDRQHTTILADYNIWTRASTCLNGVWGEYTAEQVAEILLSDESSKSMIMSNTYEYMSVGCYKNGEVTYWLVMMILT